MEWIGEVMQSNLALGVILLLGYILIRMIERKADAKINGHFTIRDREVLHRMADGMSAMAEQTAKYQDRGLDSMSEVRGIKEDVGSLSGQLATLIAQLLVSNTRGEAAMTQLLANDRDHFHLLRQLLERGNRNG